MRLVDQALLLHIVRMARAQHVCLGSSPHVNAIRPSQQVCTGWWAVLHLARHTLMAGRLRCDLAHFALHAMPCQERLSLTWCLPFSDHLCMLAGEQEDTMESFVLSGVPKLTCSSQPACLQVSAGYCTSQPVFFGR